MERWPLFCRKQKRMTNGSSREASVSAFSLPHQSLVRMFDGLMQATHSETNIKQGTEIIPSIGSRVQTAGLLNSSLVSWPPRFLCWTANQLLTIQLPVRGTAVDPVRLTWRLWIFHILMDLLSPPADLMASSPLKFLLHPPFPLTLHTVSSTV